MNKIDQIIQEKQSSVDEMVRIYDELDVVSTEFMKGRWQGLEIATGHPLEGLLETAGWYGKVFVDNQNVHPLVFYSGDRKQLFTVNPKIIPLGIGVRFLKVMAKFAPLLVGIMKTSKPGAHLRMFNYRGKLSATMTYNEKPINDVFRKIDENRVLGVMNLEGNSRLYFFVLIRDDQSDYKINGGK